MTTIADWIIGLGAEGGDGGGQIFAAGTPEQIGRGEGASSKAASERGGVAQPPVNCARSSAGISQCQQT